MLGPDHAAHGEGDEAADLVPHLAHVAGPLVRDQEVERRGLDLGRRARGGRLREEVLEQRLHVLAPVAERGQLDHDAREPVVEVLAERAGL